MLIENYLYYLIFCTLMVFSPGPMTIFLMTVAANNGFTKTLLAQLGASSAYLVSLLIFTVGLTAVFLKYEFILKFIQIIGVSYILYLAWKQWQTASSEAIIKKPTVSFKKYQWRFFNSMYFKGALVAASNPKTIILFSTVIPQFTDTDGGIFTNTLTLAVTFLIMQCLSGITYSYFGQNIQK